MAVDSVNGGVAYTSYLQSTLLQVTQNTGTTQGADGNNDNGKVGGSKGGGHNNAFVNSIMETLSQLGITPNIQSGSTPATTSAADTGNDNTQSGANSDKQALHAFMHSLFHALNQNAPAAQAQTATGGAPSASDNYANLTTNLQNLLQSLNSSTAGGGNSQLNSAFKNLIQTLQANSGATGAGNATSGSLTSLQAFLQALIQNLPNQQQGVSAIGSGNILNTMG
ncbi:MAG: hypothetical protein HQK98_04925 [Nitrospirae bacterium]|nr:hypothetical protein [Nitrospirota bacterium]